MIEFQKKKIQILRSPAFYKKNNMKIENGNYPMKGNYRGG
jgi:hypothetical protein